ncbi:MAG TPA: hypothetical protein VFQ61_12390 [Polyangiaceae bacterium]|nr:hypothetical protein [Polyangiaceae bacterium]
MDINLAYRTYVGGTVPSAQKLRAQSHDIPPATLEAWISEFEKLHRALEGYLEAGQVSDWKAETQDKVLAFARESHPWLDADSGRSLLSFVGWYGWHEGLIHLGC